MLQMPLDSLLEEVGAANRDLLTRLPRSKGKRTLRLLIAGADAISRRCLLADDHALTQIPIFFEVQM